MKIFKEKMTTMDIITLIEGLQTLETHFVNVLREACGECDNCGHCEDIVTENIQLPDYLLEVAGIPKNAKLIAYVEEDSGVVTIEEAEYDYDLADVSEEMRDFLLDNGVCLGELDALLVSGDVIYG